jgi:hypothetical protein
LKKSGIINHVLLISNCAGLFFRFSEYADPETQAQISSAYEEVWKKMIKKMALVLATISFLLVFALPVPTGVPSSSTIEVQGHIGTF